MRYKGIVLGDRGPWGSGNVVCRVVHELTYGEHATDSHTFGGRTGGESCPSLVGNVSRVGIEEAEDLFQRGVAFDELKQLARFRIGRAPQSDQKLVECLAPEFQLLQSPLANLFASAILGRVVNARFVARPAV